jgi:hypothetical protein
LEQLVKPKFKGVFPELIQKKGRTRTRSRLQCFSSKVVGKTEEENRRQFASEAQPCQPYLRS